ncbi:sorting and assembly machinery component 50 [Chlorobaculum thiosulfatiphilum]|uniref:Sorting and assembly machinery component 50 n=1 Tax=Chlorobaculum thiosulfatiphilum TaxID=115852 RepID=A0A5C4S893_CHLTI|nr:sorting and assembly machinery component 50 [Chlorobaculum thiosulfatiphilum]TNJ39646.1 sorting and assembly machinery component 50 [Chlorobaculum thiosulfatiphilum]
MAVWLLLILSMPGALWAEQSSPPSNGNASSLPQVKNIKITGNKALSTEDIRGVMSTTTRDSFLGTGLFAGARRPFIADDFQKDIDLIRKLYTFKGYFFADVDPTVTRSKTGDASIVIRIRENQPTLVDSLSYAGLDSVSANLRSRYLRSRRLKTGQIFSVENLIDERDRTLDFFREYGYTFFHPDSIRITVDTLGLHAGVRFNISLPGRHAYGPVKVFVHNPLAKDNPATAKTFERENVSVTIYGNQKFSPKVFSSAIAWKQGALTRQSLEQRTLENFGSTNLFSSISIQKDTVSTAAIPVTIDLDPSPKHQIEPKLLVDNRYGSLFVGGALAYENRNLFGAGQQFRLSTNYGTQTSSNTSVLSNLSPDQYDKIIPYEFNIKAEMVIPTLGKQGSFYTGTLEYAQSKQPVLIDSQRKIIRGTYSTRPTRNSKLSFDFFELEVARKDSLRGFQQLFKTDLAENIGIDPADPVAVKRGLDSLLQTRLNQTFRLRYNYSNRDNASRRRKSTLWNFSAVAEESGSLLWLIDNVVDTKSYNDFASSDAQIFGTPYNQYVKFDTQLAVTKELSPDRQVAAKVALGWMSPYGKANTTPEDHRFYAGGSNSMRGWVFGTLGPGSNSNEAVSNFGADIKAELGLEYRMQLFKVFGQKSGVTLFTDAGNIWDRTGPYAFSLQSLTRDFAWDLGAGLRIGSPIGPFRFDFAWKLHDPADPQRWQFSKMNLTDFTFNFGIGEAF